MILLLISFALSDCVEYRRQSTGLTSLHLAAQQPLPASNHGTRGAKQLRGKHATRLGTVSNSTYIQKSRRAKYYKREKTLHEILSQSNEKVKSDSP
jgi:hypothetical protein